MKAFSLALAMVFGLAAVAQAQPNVVTVIVPVHSLVANVMEGVGEPALLIEGAASPHAYELAPSEAAALESAERIFWIGPEIETFLVRVMRNLDDDVSVPLITRSGVALLPLREAGAFEAHAHADHDEHGHVDHDEDGHAGHDGDGHDGDGHDEDAHGEREEVNAHIWLDPGIAMRLVEVIAAELGAIDPANADRYNANAHETIQRLQALDAELAARLAPVRDVPYVVFHDAYAYFEARYGLRVVGSITLNADRAPGARRLYEVRNKIVDTDAACVFAEPQFKPGLVATVVEGTGARAGVLDPLGAFLTPGPDAYFILLENLAEALRDCLRQQ